MPTHPSTYSLTHWAHSLSHPPTHNHSRTNATHSRTHRCFKFTLLYSGQESWSANLSSAAPASSGTYTCGSYSEVLTLFDNKADARWTGITYADANVRVSPSSFPPSFPPSSSYPSCLRTPSHAWSEGVRTLNGTVLGL